MLVKRDVLRSPKGTGSSNALCVHSTLLRATIASPGPDWYSAHPRAACSTHFFTSRTRTKEVSMNKMNRRSALALSLVVPSAVVVTKSVTAQPYALTEGREIAPGVRQVDLTKRESMIPSYKTVSMRDVVYQPN